MQFEFHRDFFGFVMARSFVAFFGILEWQEESRAKQAGDWLVS